METFQIRGMWKFTEQDVWDSGCQPGTGSDYLIDVTFRADSVAAVIQKAADFLGVDADAIELDACDELGRVDFALTENDDGAQLTPAELAKWKAGELRAWYAVYTAHVERTAPVSAKAAA